MFVVAALSGLGIPGLNQSHEDLALSRNLNRQTNNSSTMRELDHGLLKDGI